MVSSTWPTVAPCEQRTSSARISRFGSATALAESPHDSDALWVGTDDRWLARFDPRTGAFVRTWYLSAGEPREVLTVPSGAIQEIRGRPIVFVRTAEGSFERRDVAIGAEAEGWVEVRSGVREGEAVATAGSFLLKSELLKGTMVEEE